MTEALALWTPPTEVVLAQHAFRTETVHLELPAGATIDELILAAGVPSWATVRVWVDDWEIRPQFWGVCRPRPGRKVLIRAVAGGGGGGDKNKTLRIVLMVVILVAAIALTVATSGMAAPVFLGLSGAALGMIGAAVISVGGMMLINALLPPPKPKFRDNTMSAVTPTYAITGTQNQLAPYQAVPRVYGRHRLFPPLAAHPWTWGAATNQTLTQLFTLGYGPLAIEDIRIGDTPLGQYEGVNLQVRAGWPNDPQLTYPNPIWEEPLGVDLTPPTGSTINSAMRTTRPDADWLSIEVMFPRGLFRIDDKNDTHPFGGQLVVDVYPQTSGGVRRVLDQWIEEKRPETLRYTWAWNMAELGYPRQAYAVQVTWMIPAGWEGEQKPNPVVIYDTQWVALRTASWLSVIQPPEMATIALTLTASGQLTGVVNQLNCIATSLLWRWSGTSWASGEWQKVPTRNPAWIYHDVLTGSGNARPLPADRIDWETLLAWALDCEAQGFTFDAVYDSQSTVYDVLNSVAAAGRASPTVRDGKFSVVRDVPQTVPVQQFTPRNSSGFSATKIFIDVPHGLKVRFINPARDWQQDERLVYDDGYHAGNATKFEGLDLFGCTSPDLAWRFGRYWLATARLRPETYTLNVDIEHLVAQRGDLVQVQHDVPLWGYATGRIVKTFYENGLLRMVTIDECLDDVPAGSWLAMRARTAAGDIVLRGTSVYPDPATRSTDLWIVHEALALAEGDLVSIGEWNRETVSCIISKIEAGPELSARLTLVDAAPAIHTADQGAIPPYESYISHRPALNRLAPLPPVVDAVASDESAMLLTGGGWQIAIRLACHAQYAAERIVPTLLVVEFRPFGSDASWRQAPPQPATSGVATFYLMPVQEGVLYDVRVRAYAETESVASPWTTFTHLVIGEINPPPAPINLQLTLDQTQLMWQYPTPPPDFPGGFKIRYTYGVGGSWEYATQPHGALLSETAYVLPPLLAGTYTFFCKAVDRTGHESRDAALLVADLSGYVPYNIVAGTDYSALGFPGDLENLHHELEPPPPRICNDLLADGPHWTVNSALYWTADPQLFWTDKYKAGCYTLTFTVPPEDDGTMLTLEWAGSGSWTIEYAGLVDAKFWPEDAEPYWSADRAWLRAAEQWRPWPGGIRVVPGEYKIRWCTPGPAESCLTHIETVYDVPDLIEWIDDVPVPVGGARLPVVNTYRVITNVQLTVVQTAGTPVRVADVLDKTPAGPLIRVRFVDGTPTTGQVDATIKGY